MTEPRYADACPAPAFSVSAFRPAFTFQIVKPERGAFDVPSIGGVDAAGRDDARRWRPSSKPGPSRQIFGLGPCVPARSYAVRVLQRALQSGPLADGNLFARSPVYSTAFFSEGLQETGAANLLKISGRHKFRNPGI